MKQLILIGFNLRCDNARLLVFEVVTFLSVLAPLALVFTFLTVLGRRVFDHVTGFPVHLVDLVEMCGFLCNG